MKKIISFLCILSILASFASCSTLNPKYKNVAEMQADLIGTWTSSDGHEQIIISSDKIDYIHRNENYEDNSGYIPELFWDHKKGIIDSLQTEATFTVSDDYQTIMWLGNIYNRGGELVENPLPEERLFKFMMKIKYSFCPYSTDFENLYNNIPIRNLTINYYKLEEYTPTDSETSTISQMTNQYNGEFFIVVLKGEVPATLEEPIPYYESYKEFIKFIIVLDEDGRTAHVNTIYASSPFDIIAGQFFAKETYQSPLVDYNFNF